MEEAIGNVDGASVIIARFTVTLDLFVMAIRVVYKFKRLWLVLPILLIVYGAVIFALKSNDSSSIAAFVCTILFGGPLYYFGFVPWFQRYSAKRQLAASGLANTIVEWQISADKLCVKSKNSTSDMSWGAIKKAYCTQRGFGLFIHPALMNWIPKEAFASAEEFSRASDLVKSNVKTVAIRNR